jgi:hypothetical protein
MSRLAACLRLLPLLPSLAVAHEGHGIEGASHYHATDVWGFVSMAVAAALVWWFTGRDK